MRLDTLLSSEPSTTHQQYNDITVEINCINAKLGVCGQWSDTPNGQINSQQGKKCDKIYG